MLSVTALHMKLLEFFHNRDPSIIYILRTTTRGKKKRVCVHAQSRCDVLNICRTVSDLAGNKDVAVRREYILTRRLGSYPKLGGPPVKEARSLFVCSCPHDVDDGAMAAVHLIQG